MSVTLIKTTEADLEKLFIFQTDKDANYKAAFTSENPNDEEAYLKKWKKIIANPTIDMQTIRQGNVLVGSVLHFDMGGETNVSYWIDRQFWGKGIATEALQLFLEKVQKRPLFGQVAFDNIASQKVLTKYGFIKVREELGFANARNKEIVELIYKLDS